MFYIEMGTELARDAQNNVTPALVNDRGNAEISTPSGVSQALTISAGAKFVDIIAGEDVRFEIVPVSADTAGTVPTRYLPAGMQKVFPVLPNHKIVVRSAV